MFSVYRDELLCKECYFEDKHEEHKDQMHAYYWIAEVDVGDDITCDCCGEPQTHADCTIWQCIWCEEYGLCDVCNYMDM